MAKDKKDGAPAAPRKPKLLAVAPPMSLLWPFNPQPLRCPAFSVVSEDDPLLDTTNLDPALAREFAVMRFGQRDRLMGAPDGAVLTPHASHAAHELYRRLGYADPAYQPAAVADAEKAARAALLPPKPDLRRESTTLKPSDLDAIPDRKPSVPAGDQSA